MINFNNSINEVMSKPIRIIIIVFQLTFVTLLTYNIIDRNIYSKFKTSDVYSALSGKYVLNLSSGNTISNFNLEQKENMNKLYDYLKNNDEFKTVYSAKVSMGIKSFDGDSKFIDSMYTDITGNSQVNGYTIVNGIEVGSNFFENIDIRISNGDLDKFNSFNLSNNNDYIPVVLGSDYSSIFRIGDSIQSENNILEVVAFLEPDQYFTSIGSSYYPKFMSNLNNFIIYPQIDNNLGNIGNYSLVFKKNTSIKYITNKVKEKLVTLGLPFKILNPQEQIDIFNDEMNFEINTSKLLLYLIVIFIYVGTTASLIASISKRKKEFGVHIMSGASITDISLQIFYEMLVIDMLSTSLLIAYLKFGDTNLFINILGFNIQSLMLSIFILFAFTFLICIVPMIKIKSLNITDMIKGED